MTNLVNIFTYISQSKSMGVEIILLFFPYMFKSHYFTDTFYFCIYYLLKFTPLSFDAITLINRRTVRTHINLYFSA